MLKIDPLFATHKLNAQGQSKAQAIASDFNDLLFKLSFYTEPGREASIMRTKLEEAAFYAKKSMASNDANQEM